MSRLDTKYQVKKVKSYEKGNLEDDHSDHFINPDGGTDRDGHHFVHGLRSTALTKANHPYRGLTGADAVSPPSLHKGEGALKHRA